VQASQAEVQKGPARDVVESLWGALPVSERRLLLLVIDMLIVNGSVLIASWVWQALNQHAFDWGFVVSHWRWFPFMTAFWGALAWFSDLYEIDLANRRLASVQRLLIAMVVLVALYMILYFFAPPSVLPRLFVLVFAGLSGLLLSLWRWGYATVFTLPQMQCRVLIVGAGWAGRTLAKMLQDQENDMYQVLGFVDDDFSKHNEKIVDLPVLGGGDHLLELVAVHQADKVVLAITGDIRGELFQALIDCRAKGIEVIRMPDLYERLTRRVPVEHINMGWVLGAMSGFTAINRLERITRRVMDLGLGFLGLIGLGLILPFVALAVALDDSGPLFYRQIRAGKAGVPYHVIKFRSMRTDAEKDGSPQWAQEEDDRITRVGRVLRKTRLDELPQVINILRGEMCIVGPRPERPAFIADLEDQIPFYRTRLTVKPGLTGWAQINYKYGNSVQDSLMKLQYDLYYIRHRSLWLDIYIVLKTFGVMLRMEGM
jgi:exopolysaccharide biosynthesis polyprenyl glycosylphosphotransferase